jgi:single-strand DNA-binding protein
MKTMQNAVTLGGNLGSDIEITRVGAGKRLARTSLATNEYYKDKDGASQKRTQWHDLVAWDSTADRMHRDLTKGSYVVIHGKLVNREYLDRNGTTRAVSEIVVREFSFMKPIVDAVSSTAA